MKNRFSIAVLEVVGPGFSSLSLISVDIPHFPAAALLTSALQFNVNNVASGKTSNKVHSIVYYVNFSASRVYLAVVILQ